MAGIALAARLRASEDERARRDREEAARVQGSAKSSEALKQVVVESEVKKIRADLEVKLANQYGDKIQTLQTQTAKMANDMKR